MTATGQDFLLLVPAGEHEVVFSYEPKGVKIGFWISLIAVIFGISYLGFSVISKKT